MNLIQTKKTYKTVDNATKALERTLFLAGLSLADARYLIGVAPDGRYVPVLVGQQFVSFAVNANITVVG